MGSHGDAPRRLAGGHKQANALDGIMFIVHTAFIVNQQYEAANNRHQIRSLAKYHLASKTVLLCLVIYGYPVFAKYKQVIGWIAQIKLNKQHLIYAVAKIDAQYHKFYLIICTQAFRRWQPGSLQEIFRSGFLFFLD
ncbi:MAG: hypothetical protein GXP19_04890 [Gammaproteobacteria bacterium]|nr:hypothetical protein [Gammaproteobacteria bacterium]